jgi:uncharacterized protein YciI
MLFVVRFTDSPKNLDLRRRLLPAHLKWLEKRQTEVLVAGSLRAELKTESTHFPSSSL